MNLILQGNLLLEHLWGGGRRTGPAVGLSVDRILPTCLFWLLFVVRQKVTREKIVEI
ncbi:hypothetical protein [Aquiflexum gelatinilyticum]|uniref:hypothetical protein n=1 Tax=Aquiflexum gelatinilyticum TaxID=2961943 RepID=UPI00216A171F|nr:hypothetical protein [Aquiflexum gelatinilyticum]MCS4433186.1 hypothetical protein [Aquiflexum gelatinilyticum]